MVQLELQELHEDKFDLMSHRTTPDTSLFQLPFIAYVAASYSISYGDKIVPAQIVRDLGVIVMEYFSWSLHVVQLKNNGTNQHGSLVYPRQENRTNADRSIQALNADSLVTCDLSRDLTGQIKLVKQFANS